MRLEEKKLLLDGRLKAGLHALHLGSSQPWPYVQQACESIQDRCAGHTFEEYSGDRWFRRAVEREFEIIGEALNRLTRLAPESATRITSLRRIVDFRNRIIHGYDSVDDVIVWRTAQEHVPVSAMKTQFEFRSGNFLGTFVCSPAFRRLRDESEAWGAWAA